MQTVHVRDRKLAEAVFFYTFQPVLLWGRLGCQTAKADGHHYAKISHIAGQLILLAAVTS